MATYRHWSVSLWRNPDDVSHCRILSPDKTEWRLISATLCRWGRCFVADQLWLMTRIREEEDCRLATHCFVCFVTFKAHKTYWNNNIATAIKCWPTTVLSREDSSCFFYVHVTQQVMSTECDCRKLITLVAGICFTALHWQTEIWRWDGQQTDQCRQWMHIWRISNKNSAMRTLKPHLSCIISGGSTKFFGWA